MVKRLGAAFVVVLLGFVAVPVQAAPPSYDDFASAANTGNYPFISYSSDGYAQATLESGEPQPPCGPVDHTVWFKVTLSGPTWVRYATEATVTSPQGEIDYSVVAAYTGSSMADLLLVNCAAGHGLPETCSDRACAAVESMMSAGTYFFQAGVGPETSGDFLYFELTQLPPPANDDRAGATALPSSTRVWDHAASTELGEPQPTCSPVDRTVWYSFAAGTASYLGVSAGTIRHNYAGPMLFDDNSVVALYEVGPLGELSLIACAAGGGASNARCSGNFFSRCTVAAAQIRVGARILVQVGLAPGTSSREQEIGSSLVVAPANDDVQRAQVVSAMPFGAVTNTLPATVELGEQQPCAGIARTVWYKFTPSAAGYLTASTRNSNFDSALAVYASSSVSVPASMVNLACNDNRQAGVTDAYLELLVQPGVTYYIQVGGHNGAGGNAVLTLESDAQGLPSLPGPPEPGAQPCSQHGDGVAPTVDGEPVACLPGHSVGVEPCYQNGEGVTPTVDGRPTTCLPGQSIGASPCPDGGAQVQLNGQTLNDCPPSQPPQPGIAPCSAFGDGVQPTLDGEPATPCLPGHRAAAGVCPDGKHVEAWLDDAPLRSCPGPRPANDDRSAPTAIATLPFVIEQDTSGATTEPGEPAPSCLGPASPLGRPSVWFAYTKQSAPPRSANTRGSDHATVVAVYHARADGQLIEDSCAPGAAGATVDGPIGRVLYIQVSGVGDGGRLRFDLR